MGKQRLTCASPLFETYAQAINEVVSETVWPTRCALCNTLGTVLCDTCRARLPYIDYWKACPVCGAPYGKNQCSECNSYTLESLGRKKVPFIQGVSAVQFDSNSARIARIRKDSGERRLSEAMAYAIVCAIPPHWIRPTTIATYIPSTKAAIRKRGFCHARDLAHDVARFLRVPCEALLSVEQARDQRLLSRQQRAQNIQGRFMASVRAARKDIILIDDVYTTGSTLMSASDALNEAGCASVRVAVFARVIP